MRDAAAPYRRGEDGKLLRGEGWSHVKKPPGDRVETWVTGLTGEDYLQGKRDRFPSWQVQTEMLALWPYLLEGLWGDFRRLRPGWTGRAENGRLIPVQRMRFGQALQRELTGGLWLARA